MEPQSTIAGGFPRSSISPLNGRFFGASPHSLLTWTFEVFGDGAVMGTGFGASGVVLMDMLAAVLPGATVFYLDTDLLFPETHVLRDRLERRFDLTFERVSSVLTLDEQVARHGEGLWKRDPDRCCSLRKVAPLRAYLAGKAAWITAIRRDQSPTRTETGSIEWSASNRVVKVNPLATWTERDIWAYLRARDLPYNPLHDEGYPSIGCVPCTNPVAGETPGLRAGRWAGHEKLECGLHLELPTLPQ